jgi:hypothetical protein
MSLRASIRNKDGKARRYWSIVENRQLGDDRKMQRHVLHLGDINDSQQAVATPSRPHSGPIAHSWPTDRAKPKHQKYNFP